MRRCSWIIMMVAFTAVIGCGSFSYQPSDLDALDLSSEITVTVEPLTRPQICAELLVPHEDLYWDKEQEVYLPINVDWQECMGVGPR